MQEKKGHRREREREKEKERMKLTPPALPYHINLTAYKFARDRF